MTSTIIEARTTHDLERARLAEGWRCQGGVAARVSAHKEGVL